MKILSVYINKKSKIFQTISLILILSILSYFLVFSKTNYKIMSNIVDIFISTVIPSLFSFILFSNILIYSNYFNLIVNTRFSKIIQRFFKVSNYGSSAILFGFLFGYPNGAKYVNELYKTKKITFKEAEYLLLYINNSSPAFILSSVGIGMFGNIKIGALLLISHILASMLVGKIFSKKYKLKYDKKFKSNNDTNSLNTSDYALTFEVITKAITKSIYTMCMIFGFMVTFILSNNYISKILSLLFSENKYISSFMLCIMEITSGLNKLIQLPFNLKNLIVLVSLFLGFSSLSIIFQIFSCVYKNNFKFKNILKGKILHGILSGIITYALLSIPHIYEYINISKQVNYNYDLFKYSNIISSSIFILLTICSTYLFTLVFLLKKKRLKNRFS